MPELILHHYPSSPFSEKIRLILGYKKLRWQSVIIPIIMPKNDVVALTGGYRRTPVLQQLGYGPWRATCRKSWRGAELIVGATSSVNGVMPQLFLSLLRQCAALRRSPGSTLEPLANRAQTGGR